MQLLNVYMKNNFAILVLSCDKYSSLWKPFFVQLDRNWKNCPYKIYLGNNTQKFNWSKVEIIHANFNKDWSSNVLSILSQIPEENLFIWLDDYFIIDKMNQIFFEKCRQFFIQNKANHMHMTASVPSLSIKSNSNFGVVEKGAPYRLAAYGFWKKSHLQKMLIPGENIWQFEVFGSYRSGFFDGYYNIRKDLFKYIQIVARGKIFREAFIYCKKHNIDLDASSWSIHSIFTTFRNDIFRFLFSFIIRMPWKIRIRCTDFCRKIFATY